MKRIAGYFAWLLISVCFCATARGAVFADETLHYRISYKWGLIQKDAGEATLSLRGAGSRYNLRLTAHTLPWADEIFMVRDTLLASVDKNGLLPLSYSKISHEGGDYRRDDITYTRAGSKTTAAVKRAVRKKDGRQWGSTHTYSATGTAYDMLSVFYYLRTLDFNKLERSRITRTAIFSGSQVETLTIRYAGRKEIKMRKGGRRDAIKITFSFTTDGRRKSSESIEAWISADARHIPLQIIGKLPIGAVRVDLTGG
ncbi:MAG: DUF3108 domain-containing protein [Muribaculaceae bacterium]|nr:DUF3108 domain-containing protein [Muribaculaceae bacterium]